MSIILQYHCFTSSCVCQNANVNVIYGDPLKQSLITNGLVTLLCNSLTKYSK